MALLICVPSKGGPYTSPKRILSCCFTLTPAMENVIQLVVLAKRGPSRPCPLNHSSKKGALPSLSLGSSNQNFENIEKKKLIFFSSSRDPRSRIRPKNYSFERLSNQNTDFWSKFWSSSRYPRSTIRPKNRFLERFLKQKTVFRNSSQDARSTIGPKNQFFEIVMVTLFWQLWNPKGGPRVLKFCYPLDNFSFCGLFEKRGPLRP